MHVTGDGVRHGGQDHGSQAADVDTHLQGRGGDQHVGGVGSGGFVGPEFLFDGLALFVWHQPGVFGSHDGAGFGGAVHLPVVVIRNGDFHEVPGAGADEAGRVDQLLSGTSGHAGFCAAGGALQHPRVFFLADDHRVLGQRVHRALGARVRSVQCLQVGEVLQQLSHRMRSGRPVELQYPLRPGCESASGGVRGNHPGALLLAQRLAHTRELRRIVLREGGHSLVLGADGVQVVRVGVIFQIVGHEAMPNTAFGTDSFDYAAGPRQQHGVLGGGILEHHVSPVHSGSCHVDQQGVVDVDHRGQGAGQQQGSGKVRSVAELEVDVHLESLTHPVASVEALGTTSIGFPVGTEVLVMGNGRRQ